jgi:7-keto-8-aminopelargonate synthetase-like enzyme
MDTRAHRRPTHSSGAIRSHIGSHSFCSADRPRHKFAKMSKQVLDRASCNFTGLVCDETVQVHAIGTPRKYGVVNCGRPEFYGTIGASVYPQFAPT